MCGQSFRVLRGEPGILQFCGDGQGVERHGALCHSQRYHAILQNFVQGEVFLPKRPRIISAGTRFMESGTMLFLRVQIQIVEKFNYSQALTEEPEEIRSLQRVDVFVRQGLPGRPRQSLDLPLQH